MYAVVIAHKDGQAVERAMRSTLSPTLADAQAHADRWTRHHGRGPLEIDRLGFYAYADRVSGAREPHAGSNVRMWASER